MGVPGATKLHVINKMLAAPGHRFRVRVLDQLGWALQPDVVVGRGLQLTALKTPVIGDRVNLGPSLILDLRGGVTIGSDVDIAGDVTLWTADHDPDSAKHSYRERPVSIGNRCWIGHGAEILPGSIIPDGVVIGARAVVAGSLEPDGIYGGNPLRRIRDRNPAAMQRLSVWRQPWQ